MEVYLNVAETGIGTYGVNAGSERYFHHDASNMSRTEAARIAAILPLPKKRGAVAPRGFTRRYGNSISARIGVVARQGLDVCVYSGRRTSEPPEPIEKTAPTAPTKVEPVPEPDPVPTVDAPSILPGEEYEAPPSAQVPQEAPAAEPAPPAPTAPGAPTG